MITSIILSILSATLVIPSDSLNQEQWLIDEWQASYGQVDLTDYELDNRVYMVQLNGTIGASYPKEAVTIGELSTSEMSSYLKADFMFATGGDEFYLLSETPSEAQAAGTSLYSLVK